MAYIEGFVIAVPVARKQEFIDHGTSMDSLFLELGALRVMECWEDDVPEGQVTDFRKAVQAHSDEAVVFSWIEWPDKHTRDSAMSEWEERAKTDDRYQMDPEGMPFDGKRMIFGGFTPVLALGA